MGYVAGEAHLQGVLKKLGFRWKLCENNRRLFMERQDVVLSRIRFLRQIKKLRDDGRPIVYVDETFVNTSHSWKKCWQSDEIMANVPFNKGERLIVVHAGAVSGFVSGAKLIFKANT
jgi:hypothetical protein